MSKELSDNEINFAQHLLKLQFTKLNGLHSKLLRQAKLAENETKNKIQIIHCNTHHCVTIIGCELNQVRVHDSLFTYYDMKSASNNYFMKSKAEKGLLILACLLSQLHALAFGNNPSKLQVIQEVMRPQLIKCFNQELTSVFPYKCKQFIVNDILIFMFLVDN